ncbi:MAG: cache domain-containing protein [Bacillaceae bacterium]|nr:cache domain-containing protein [Bacillaceae bacterium]
MNITKFTLQSIRTKLIMIALILLIIPSVTIGIISYNSSKTGLDDLGAVNLKNNVKMAVKLIETLNTKVEEGAISLEDAQERAKVLLIGEKQNDGTRKIDQSIDIGENGYFFILDNQGILLGHPSIEGQNLWDEEDDQGNKFIQDIINIAKNGGYTYYEWPLPGYPDQIEPKISYSEQDPNWGWVIAASTYMLDFNKKSNDIFYTITMTIIISIIVGVLVIWLFSNSIAKPISQVTNQMKKIAHGDLSQEDLTIRTKDEVGQLANAMNIMKNGLKEIIHSVSNASDQVSSQSEELTQSANEVTEGSEQIASTMQELSAGAETQANSATSLSEMMKNFLEKIQESHEKGETISESSNEVVSMTQEGQALMTQSVLQMEKINQIVNDAVAKVKGLDQQTKDISKLVQVIEDIAEQTNLLALNAAIEAARAGEHGKGFAVVADEVRKLAEQVSTSIGEITSIVSSIQTESKNVVESLEFGYNEVESGTQQIRQTGETFEKMNQSFTEMAASIQSISENLKDISDNSKDMNRSIEEVASVSEEAAAGVEEASASVQQTSSSMEDISNSADELAKLAEHLNEQVKKFQLL